MLRRLRRYRRVVFVKLRRGYVKEWIESIRMEEPPIQLAFPLDVLNLKLINDD